MEGPPKQDAQNGKRRADRGRSGRGEVEKMETRSDVGRLKGVGRRGMRTSCGLDDSD
jgi:hypothetical protein